MAQNGDTPNTRHWLRLAIAGAAAVSLSVVMLRAQGTGAQPPAVATAPSFEVASVRLNTSGSENASMRAQPGGRATVTNNSLRNIIRNAYQVQAFQIVGGPEWAGVDRWDIVAKAEGDAQPAQMLLMFRTFLADRFKLAVHTEIREMPVYALVVARRDGRLGPQLRPAALDCAAVLESLRARGQASGATPPTFCGSTQRTRGNIKATSVSMSEVARSLGPSVGRVVVDKTMLPGIFDLELSALADDGATVADAAGGPGDGASIFTALQEQLGLKLEAQRGPVEVLVIDRAERPTED